jgi:hypothetical protein
MSSELVEILNLHLSFLFDKGNICVFLCEKENTTSELRQAMTKQLDKWLIKCARNLNDGKFMAVLSGGDVAAQELKYHHFCLTALYNKERAYLLTIENQDGFPIYFITVYSLCTLSEIALSS